MDQVTSSRLAQFFKLNLQHDIWLYSETTGNVWQEPDGTFKLFGGIEYTVNGEPIHLYQTNNPNVMLANNFSGNFGHCNTNQSQASSSMFHTMEIFFFFNQQIKYGAPID